jgi:hypothetical protein
MTVRIFKHEAVPRCGSYEVRLDDGRPSVFFLWDDDAGRRDISAQKDLTGSKIALEKAKAFARKERGPAAS